MSKILSDVKIPEYRPLEKVRFLLDLVFGNSVSFINVDGWESAVDRV